MQISFAFLERPGANYKKNPPGNLGGFDSNNN